MVLEVRIVSDHVTDKKRNSPVFGFIVRKVIAVTMTLLAASLVVFFVLNILPGKPAQVILGTQATPASVAALTNKLGLNKPLVTQYFSWIWGLARLHLGNSYLSGQPIGSQIASALQVTGPLVGIGTVIGIVVAVPMGILGAIRSQKLSGLLLSSLSQVGIAVPNFLAGLILIYLAALKLQILPASGFIFWSSSASQALRSLVLPAVSLGLVEGAILSRYIRSSIIEVLRSDYLRTARAKGLLPRQALLRHGLRNAALPVLTVLGLELSGLIVGSVVIENVFTLPGMGTLLISAVENRDLIIVQDIVMVVAAAVLFLNLIVDLLYRLVDPRIRIGS